MAWNTIKFACGHTEEQQLYGKTSERERTVAAALNHDCSACRAEKAAAADKSAGLPALQGTEKQIGWASECRARMLPLLDAQAQIGNTIIARIDAGEADGKATAERIAAERAKTVEVIAKIERIKANQKASYWIDNRITNVQTMIAEAK